MFPGGAGGREPERRRLRFGGLELDTASGQLSRGGKVVSIEPRAFDLLLCLLEHRDRLVTKAQLTERVWRGAFVTDNAVDRAVARLRKTLGDDVRQPRFIETVPSRGYRFVAVVEESAQPPANGAQAPASPGPTGGGAITGLDAASDAAARAEVEAPERGSVRPGSPASAIGRRAVATMAGISVAAGIVFAALAFRGGDSPPAASVTPPPRGAHVIARQVTFDAAFEFAPTFSPDGSAIAFTSNRAGHTSIWVRALGPEGRDRELAETAGARIASWSPDGRWLVYDSYEGIWVVPAVGGSPRQLVERGGAPRWSPDGSTIVFQQTRTDLDVEGVDINACVTRPATTLWSVGLDGAAPRRLTSSSEPPGGHGQPAYSHDGSRLAFVAELPGQPSSLWTMSSRGGELRQVLERCYCRDPVFSLEDDRLYYIDIVGSQYGLWEVDSSGGTPRRLYETSLRFLALSPDGRAVATSRQELSSDLWSIAVEPSSGAPRGREEVLVEDAVYRAQFPVPSPDGRRLAFVALRPGHDQELWTSGIDGRQPELLASGGVFGWSAWAPDSRAIYFVHRRGLCRVDLATRRVETVLRTELPWRTTAVAPGGAAVAFSMADADGVSNVWTLDRAGRATQVTRDTITAHHPTWSPDGRYLAVEVKRADGSAGCGYVEAGGGEVVLLTEGEELCFTGGWSPDGDRIAVARRPLRGPQEHWDIGWVSIARGQAVLTERPLGPMSEFVRTPAWSPAGDRVFFELAQSSADIWLLELPDRGSM
jgi:Tol biopolymer transport system component/DNA-binding winged helix-turn-helix (wHTH) protein